jgi:hypothetical protein
MKYLTHLMPALALGVVIPAVPAQAQQMNNCPLSDTSPHCFQQQEFCRGWVVFVQTMVGISEQGKFKDPRDLVATFYNLTIGDSVLYLNALGEELSLRMAGNVTAWAPTHHWHDRSTFEKIFYLPVLNDCYGGTLNFVNNIGPRD